MLDERIEEFRALHKKMIEAIYEEEEEVQDYVMNKVLEPAVTEIFNEWESYCRMHIDDFEIKVRDKFFDQIHSNAEGLRRCRVKRNDLHKHCDDTFRGFYAFSQCIMLADPNEKQQVIHRMKLKKE